MWPGAPWHSAVNRKTPLPRQVPAPRVLQEGTSVTNDVSEPPHAGVSLLGIPETLQPPANVPQRPLRAEHCREPPDSSLEGRLIPGGQAGYLLPPWRSAGRDAHVNLRTERGRGAGGAVTPLAVSE